MNVISYSHAYSLYPKATFQKFVSLICYRDFDGARRTASLKKYISRGWRVIDYEGARLVPSITSPETLKTAENLPGCHGRTFCKGRMRYLGDSYCWTHRLDDLPSLRSEPSMTPLAREEIKDGVCALESNSWTLRRGDDSFGKMYYVVTENSWLRYIYCLPHEWNPMREPNCPRRWWTERPERSIADFEMDRCALTPLLNVSVLTSEFATSDDLRLRELVKQRAHRLILIHDHDHFAIENASADEETRLAWALRQTMTISD